MSVARNGGSATEAAPPGQTPESVPEADDAEPELLPLPGDMPYPWPAPLGLDAFHGLGGKIAIEIALVSEADIAAILPTMLTLFGAAVGPTPHVVADGQRHTPRLFNIIVGRTSRGRKGTSLAGPRRIIEKADPGFAARILSGLGSGEALIEAVADPVDDDGDLSSVTSVASDKRLQSYEPEFSRILRICERDGSTLSPVLRQAYDGGDLAVLTRKNPVRATGPHITLIGHITVEELLARLASIEIANGLANRFLFFLAQRSQRLPSGSGLSENRIDELAEEIRAALAKARRVSAMRRSVEAEELWASWYMRVDDEVPGIRGALTARAEAHVLRLSLIYALLDGSAVIETVHLRAALEVWRYAAQSVSVMFGENTGDPIADRILSAVRDGGHEGIDLEAEAALFARSVSADRRERARNKLVQAGLILIGAVKTGGRPRTVLRPAESAKSAERSSASE
jgi:hypothetical protein